MATTVSSTQLDFQNIKNNLTAFLAAQSEFSDYNFEASGLNNILDVLAYNTHYNALTANFALNEAFLNTAQLRSSIISHAATLGYETRSKTAAAADITISLDLAGVAGRPTVITLPSGFQFTAKVGDKTFTFQTQQNYLATDDGTGKYDFLNDTIVALSDTAEPLFWLGGQDLSIKNSPDVMPSNYFLSQNFPNPFNPITTLKYELPEDSFVDLTIYDMLGNVVNNLINTNQSSGYKSVQWDATNNQGEPVSAGVYLYKIQASNFIDTKKMIFLK